MLLGCVLLTPAALLTPFRAQYHRPQQRGRQLAMQVSSPFDEKEAEAPARVTGPLDLTEENVELVLDGMRPYLIADGGNVALRDIDGGVVILELQGACGSCPSSSVRRGPRSRRARSCSGAACSYQPSGLRRCPRARRDCAWPSRQRTVTMRCSTSLRPSETWDCCHPQQPAAARRLWRGCSPTVQSDRRASDLIIIFEWRWS